MFRNTTFRWLALGALLAFLASPAVAQQWAGVARVQGRVLDEDGNGLGDATIRLQYEAREGQGPEPFTTKDNGRWSFLGLADGTWQILIDKEGYIPSGGTVRLSQFKRHPDVVINLQKIPENRGQVALDRLGQGDELMSAGSYGEARAMYESALEKLEPDTYDLAYDRIARTYAAEQNFAAAIDYVDRALGVKPGEAGLLQFKAQLLDQSGQTDQSIELMKGLHETKPDDVATLQVLIDLLVRADREDEAQEYMSKMPEGAAISADLLLNMGIDAYNEGNYENALDAFGRAVADNPDIPEVYYYRGLVYLAQQNNELAKADLEKLIEIAPDHPKAEEAKGFLEYLTSN